MVSNSVAGSRTTIHSAESNSRDRDPGAGACAAAPREPRLHGELLNIGEASVGKYMVRHRRPPSQAWRTFLTNHIGQIVAADFFVVPTATCRVLFVLVMLAHNRRR